MSPKAQQGPEAVATGFVDKVVAVDGDDHRYVVYVPPGYDAARRWPLIVFLNGLGECGRDGRRQAAVGLGAAIQKQPERWPFVVAFPQKPEGLTQWGDHEALLLAVLDATVQQYSTDAKRTFLTGLSQGGSGAWQFGAQFADRWAAVAPICGYRLGTWKVDALAQTPVWAFHGTADQVVPVRASKMLVGELRRAGGQPVLTVYDGVQHNSWDRAYQQSALAEWLRLVADEPLGARYLADHDAAQSVELRIELEPDRSVTQPWGRRTWRVVADAEVVKLVYETEWQGQGPPPLDDERSGEFAWSAAAFDGSADGWREHYRPLVDALVWSTLRDLAATGIGSRLAAGPAAGDGDARVRLVLTVRGEPGDWVRHAELAAGDPAAAAVVAACDRIWQRAHAAAKRP